MKPLIEYRSGGIFGVSHTVESREEGSAVTDPVFTGEAIVYNQRTLIGRMPWGFYEEIDPGCLGDQLSSSDVAFLWNHDSAYPVGRTSMGGVRLDNSTSALHVEADLNTRKSYVADLVENLADGTVAGMSFGFYVDADEWSWFDAAIDEDGNAIRAELRRVLSITLLEVSAVTFPAFPQTSAGLRSTVDAVRALREKTPDEVAEQLRSESSGYGPDELRTRMFNLRAKQYASA